MGWLSGWTYGKLVTLGQASDAGTSYQVCFKIYKTSGTDGTEAISSPVVASAVKIYCSDYCQDDFGDIRFTTDDGSTELDYWMMELSSGTYAIFWVEVTADLGSGNQDIYIYCGTAGSSSTTSSIGNTFPLLGDDFVGSAEPPDGWSENNVDGGLTWLDISENSYYKVYTYQDSSTAWHGNEIYKTIDITSNYVVICSIKQKCVGSDTPQHESYMRLYASSVLKVDLGFSDAWILEIGEIRSNITGTDGDEGQDTRTIDTTVIYEIRQDGTDIKNYWNGINIQSKTEEVTIDEIRFRFVGGASLSTTDPSSELNWVIIRKFVDPEPTFSSSGAWGTESVVLVGSGSILNILRGLGIIG